MQQELINYFCNYSCVITITITMTITENAATVIIIANYDYQLPLPQHCTVYYVIECGYVCMCVYTYIVK